MGRKKQSGFENLIDGLSKLPWWVSLALAPVSYFFFHALAARPISTATNAGQMGSVVASSFMSVAGTIGQYLFPVACLVAAAISAFMASSQKTLYDGVARGTGAAAFKDLSWSEFEKLLAEHFRREGFSVAREGGNGPDGGIDLILHKDGETYLVQCKQWKAYKVGVQPVREFYGVMASRSVAGGYFVTSGQFTDEAKRFTQGLNIKMVDGRKLAQLIGTIQSTSAVSQETPKCPNCGKEMKRRVARRGNNVGQQFWGCTGYPSCKGTRIEG